MLVVYTAIFGDIGDQLRDLGSLKDCRDTEFIAFVDDPPFERHQTGWLRRQRVWTHATNPRKRARRHKLLSHELFAEAEYTLWVDGCLTPKTPLRELADRYLAGHDLCVFRHAERDCIYREAAACERLRKDDPEILREVVARYRREGYPEKNGLAETTAVLRRHTPAIRRLNDLWWHELSSFSIRDQMSFDYICWKYGVRYSVFEGSRTQSPHFLHRPHR